MHFEENEKSYEDGKDGYLQFGKRLTLLWQHQALIFQDTFKVIATIVAYCCELITLKKAHICFLFPEGRVMGSSSIYLCIYLHIACKLKSSALADDVPG